MIKINLKSKLKLFFDRSFWLFALVGCLNTAVSLSLQFVFYNLFNMGYWFSTATAFFLSSILSYYLNRKYSFQNKGKVSKTVFKFALVIAVCYVFAYSIAQPFSSWLLSKFNINNDQDLIDKIAMLVGQVVFAVSNYTGQRFFAFREKG